MEVVVVRIDTFRSLGRKVNQDDDRVRIILDMSVVDYSRFKQILMDNEVELCYKEAL